MYEYCETSVFRTTRPNLSVSIETMVENNHTIIQVVKNVKKTT